MLTCSSLYFRDFNYLSFAFADFLPSLSFESVHGPYHLELLILQVA